MPGKVPGRPRVESAPKTWPKFLFYRDFSVTDCAFLSFFPLLYMIRPKELIGIARDKIGEISLNCR